VIGEKCIDKQDHSQANEGLKVVKKDALVEARRLCAAVSHACSLGLAILDDQLRHQAINHALLP
jgi:hypothetical protein